MVVNYSRMHAAPIGQAIRDSGILFLVTVTAGLGGGEVLWYFGRKETRETGQSSLPAI